ncbi:antibiotic biosynthesis monooxygenase family protein [Spirosoma flavum]|uniref:Antibiotic biosynthesis monooxygenase family protein n=1 Tax=Spirosoma flavum TaxID=2048557 RepID=A0ABW6AK46_9BACT
MIATTPSPPYYAVIFTSVRTDIDDGYGDMALRMVELAHEQPGFLGVESARNEQTDGALGITVSYWESLESIRAWRQQAEHQIAQQTGRERWYETYKTRICKVERDYGFEQ